MLFERKVDLLRGKLSSKLGPLCSLAIYCLSLTREYRSLMIFLFSARSNIGVEVKYDKSD